MSRKRSRHNERWLPWLTEELTRLGLRVTPSVGNFVLVHFPGDASAFGRGGRRLAHRATDSSCAAS